VQTHQLSLSQEQENAQKPLGDEQVLQVVQEARCSQGNEISPCLRCGAAEPTAAFGMIDN
jgi:hypothetical protein